MMFLRAYLAYLWYVLRHKWFVFIECCRLGIPWLGLVHDLSKLHPMELRGYVLKYELPKLTGKQPGPGAEAAYLRAWWHHQKRNPHHWIYWVVFIPMLGREYDEGRSCLPMPARYAKEMLADWRGAGRALGSPDTRAWYLKAKDGMLLHPETRAWVEGQLGIGGDRER